MGWPGLQVGVDGKIEQIEQDEKLGFAERVKGAIMWRSGSQLVAQLITWSATFLVIRLLRPEDYGLFAMTQVMLVFLSLMNGYGFANALVQSETIDRQKIAQVFGMLILLNGSLAAAQFALAPAAAAYFHQPLVADLLRVQALIYFTTPLIALPNALLSRNLDFRRQAKVDLLAAFLSAGTMIVLAGLGYGVWTLVIGALVLFWTRAIGLTLAARWLVLPSFRFKGAGHMFRYGSAMVVVQFFWFLQSQSDVFIAGRIVDVHALGLYTTALLLTQILAAKFVPPLNEVAFAAYARMQGQRDALGQAFLKSVRLVMAIALPFYLGLAATAEPLVLTALGAKWADAIPLVRILALAMPFLTLQLLFVPANNGTGRAGTSLRIAIAGSIVMPACFLVGIQYGIIGMALGCLAGFPILAAVTAILSLPAIGVTATALARAVMPGLMASATMMLSVLIGDLLLPPMVAQARLSILVACGIAIYGALLFLLARPLVQEALALLRRPKPAAEAA